MDSQIKECLECHKAAAIKLHQKYWAALEYSDNNCSKDILVVNYIFGNMIEFICANCGVRLSTLNHPANDCEHKGDYR